jgi:hypothetical protein
MSEKIARPWVEKPRAKIPPGSIGKAFLSGEKKGGVMEVLAKAAEATGLPVEAIQKIANTIIWRGNFFVQYVERELHTFCCKIGMAPYYFRTIPPETIANHIESIMAAEIIAINWGS